MLALVRFVRPSLLALTLISGGCAKDDASKDDASKAPNSVNSNHTDDDKPAAPAALSAEDRAGQALQAGDKVKAPLGKRKLQSAKVLETYGKLAKLAFADSNIGWALVKTIEPAGAIQPVPVGDSCSANVGDRVRARWSTSRSLTGGVVDEVHGKLAHIQFDDKDVDWSLCADLKEPAEASGGGGGGGGESAAVTKCKRGCNSQCNGASNKAKCVGQCRRACDG